MFCDDYMLIMRGKKRRRGGLSRGASHERKRKRESERPREREEERKRGRASEREKKGKREAVHCCSSPPSSHRVPPCPAVFACCVVPRLEASRDH